MLVLVSNNQSTGQTGQAPHHVHNDPRIHRVKVANMKVSSRYRQRERNADTLLGDEVYRVFVQILDGGGGGGDYLCG